MQKHNQRTPRMATNEMWPRSADSPGSCAGKAMMGHETRMDRAPDRRKPIHQPPSHRSLFARRPRLNTKTEMQQNAAIYMYI